MKNTKTHFLLSLVTIAVALTWTSCEKLKNSFKVNEFRVVPQSDTAPAKVLIIKEITVNGTFKFKYIHKGAYTAFGNGVAIDNSEGFVDTDKEFTSKDTIIRFYLIEGTYDVILEADGKRYSESFTLLPPKGK